MTAEKSEGDRRLSGSKPTCWTAVRRGHHRGLSTCSMASLFAVESGATAWRSACWSRWTRRRLARVTFDDMLPSSSAADGSGWQHVRRNNAPGVWRRGRASRSEAREAALEMTVDDVNMRQQFGGPSGRSRRSSTAALDLLVEVDAAGSAAAYASTAVAEGADDASVAASIAQGVLLADLLSCRGGVHPDARWNRLHLEHPARPVLQTCEEF